MNRILNIVTWFLSCLGKALWWDIFKMIFHYPHPYRIGRASQGGELAKFWAHSLKLTKWMLPLLGRVQGGSFLYFLLTANCLLATAQSFPVQIVPQAIPPAPIYFSSYADASTLNGPLRVQLTLNDLSIANREIRLKAYFEGNGISFQSNDLVSGANPMYLEGGIPMILTNAELAPYFRFENITGISPNAYGQAIPEGAYKFCFEVYDILTGKRLSQKSCANTVVFQNEPPFLVAPANRSNLTETNPQNIVFQWTPRSINISNVEYELSLVEIWDNMVDPQQAFLSSPPIFQTTTNATAYLYGPADPLLLSGKNYAWRVRAMAKQGTEEIGLFKNQGNSEIYSFAHADNCDLPTGLAHEVKGGTNANIFWDDLSTVVPEYTVRYRKSPSSSPEGGKPNPSPSGGGAEGGGGQGTWFMSRTTSNQLTLWDLKAGTTYEYQLRKKCMVTKSDWSAAKQFTTFIADDASSVYECGISPDISLSNREPLTTITSGEGFTAGDFPIKILEISGSDGRFTGKGFVTIPYLNNIKVAVEFTNVLINTDRQLAEGTVVTNYDPRMKNIVDVDEAIDNIITTYDAIADLGDTTENILRDVFGEEPDNIEDEDFNSNYEGGTAPSNPPEETTISSQANSSPPITGINENNDSGPVQSNKGSISKEPSESSEKIADTKEAVIVYNGKEYKNGEIIEVPYNKKLGKQPFHCVNAPEGSKISWNVQKGNDDVTNLSWEANGSSIVLDIENFLTRTIEAQYWEPASSYPEGESSRVRVGIRVVRKEFDLVELYAKHGERRIAIAGKKLYLIDDSGLLESAKDKKVIYNVKLNPGLTEEEINNLNINWFYGPNEAISQNQGKLKISRVLRPKDTTDRTTVSAGFPSLSDKSIDIVWVDRDFQKSELKLRSDANPIIKKAFEATEITKTASNFFDKIPFIKKAKDRGSFKDDVISWYINIIPFEQSTENKENPNSRFYYKEKRNRGGFEAGLKGKAKIWTWGIPYEKLPIPDEVVKKIKDVLTAEINIVAKADATGSLFVETKEKKTIGSKDWELISKEINPSSIALNAAFGVEGELKAFNKNELFLFNAKASGLANAELMSIGWHGNSFDYQFLREGVWMDFTATMYLIVISKKLETKPYYEKVQLINPDKQDLNK